jgi:hypothetical protein
VFASWRTKFHNPKMLFLFVQLAPSTQLGNFVGLRAAQMKVRRPLRPFWRLF